MIYPWLTATYILSIATNQSTFNRGINYFRLERVADLDYEPSSHTYFAFIDGSLLYECEVTIRGTESLSYSCDCEAAATYSGACKHIVAMLFAIKEWSEERGTVSPLPSPMKKRSKMLEKFQEIFSTGSLATTVERELLQVEYELLFSRTSYSDLIDKVELRLKIGTKRLYVVKNIEEFLRAFIKDESYTFTPNFSYDPQLHLLSERDIECFKQLYTHIEIIAANQDDYYYYRSSQKRSYEIPEISLQSYLELLKDQSVVLTVDGVLQAQESKIKPLGDTKLLLCSLETEENDSQIKLVSENAHEFDFANEGFRILLHENTIYQLEQNQARHLHIIAEQVNGANELDVIPKEQLEAFCSYVLPSLQTIAKVRLSEALQGAIETKPLMAKFYLDLQNGTLTGKISFEYGEHARNPYEVTNETNEKIITRDIEKEERIVTRLKQTNFHVENGLLTLNGWDAIVPFLFEQLPILQKEMDVFTTSAVRSVIATPTSTPSVQLDVNNETNWLDVSFSMEGIADEDIMNVLQALQTNEKYYKLSSGAYLQLNHSRFDSVKNAIHTIASPKRSLQKEMSIPLHKAFELDRQDGQTRVSKKLHQLLLDIQTPEYSDWTVPSSLHAQLRDYQVTGFRWLRTLSQIGLGGILADDMGLGKTVQTIAFFQAMQEEQAQFQALIIAPASLIYNWEKEITKFAPTLRVAVIAGTKQFRKALIEESEKVDVFITSYPLIQRDYDLYESHLFSTVILDEAQAIKNDATKTTKAVRTLQSSCCFALSGTPIENHQDELFSLFHTILPGVLGTKKQFKELSTETISQRVRPFIMRRLKRDVLSELPDKLESVQYTDLSPDQKKMYVAQVKQLTNDVDAAIKSNEFQQKRIEILAGLTRLRQICCHPNLIDPLSSYESGKMERLLEYVDEGLQSEQKIVIFSQFTSMLSIIKKSFDEKGWSYHYIDGQTPPKARVEMAERFNNGEKSLFLISLKAGGTGLNLIGGDTVILYDTWWNPAIEEQAADRVYRYGQTKNVQVIKLIANGTIEEKIVTMHEKKKALVDSIIQPGEESLQSLSAEDIKQLLSL
ncbi:DEAD/DEAH box helicase [Alkalihalobacillus sp. MEB130]|uniref:DEAD/DEAH box helicase n=1 Tax=Alkalihalobacillus sp. MEB130 TaxID=2976704 RepID=UPI0028DD4DB6|nr:DEAD/DEAH box helicase [Alkalihalobacillus sp. MEB130]MDT8860101.1 DEAD/DEAH box helicase [Alkalihalobacillus sp. MEB130]